MSRRFDRTLEAATDQTLVEPNWESILECVDLIRGSDVNVKHAVQSIQKRYHNENPHVAHHALLVLEACVKNCGKKFHTEIATKEFMDDFKNIVIEERQEKVKNKVLELIQCWSSAFEKSPEYKIVCDTHAYMKMYGYDFPKLKEADAMFMADSAPEWAEGESCFRCRVEFGMFTRKHHCRSCGQIFCDRCSNRQMFLPRFGIEKKVRVCETCYGKSNEESTQKIVEKITQNGQQTNNGPDAAAAEQTRLRELEEKEREELELAMAISMSEAEAKDKSRQSGMYHQFGNTNSTNPSKNAAAPEPKPVNGSSAQSEYSYIYRGVASDSALPPADEEDDIDPALSRYLDKRYWEQRQAARDAESVNTMGNVNVRATAPPPSEMSFSTSSGDPNVNDFAYSTYNNGAPQSMQASASATPNGLTANGYGDNNSKKENMTGNAYGFNTTPTNVEQKMASVSLASNDETEQTLAFCKNLREQIEIMDNRMRSNLMRGRSVVNDSAIHSLFTQLTNRHAEVLTRMNKLDTDREFFEGLQDHLAYIQEARQALVSLREEHSKQLQERLLEEQRLRMQQMQVKLEQIRHKKYENLLEQRHQALQRLQEEELRIQQNRNMSPQQNVPMQQPVGLPQQGAPIQQPGIAPQSNFLPSQQFQGNFPPQQYPGNFPLPQQQQQYHPSAFHQQQPNVVPHPADIQQPVGLPQQYQGIPMQQHPGVVPNQADVQQQPQAPTEDEPLIVFD